MRWGKHQTANPDKKAARKEKIDNFIKSFLEDSDTTSKSSIERQADMLDRRGDHDTARRLRVNKMLNISDESIDRQARILERRGDTEAARRLRINKALNIK